MITELNDEDRDTVVDMINYVLIDLEVSDWMSDEEVKDTKEFEARTRKLADKLGLKKKEADNGSSSS